MHGAKSWSPIKASEPLQPTYCCSTHGSHEGYLTNGHCAARPLAAQGLCPAGSQSLTGVRPGACKRRHSMGGAGCFEKKVSPLTKGGASAPGGLPQPVAGHAPWAGLGHGLAPLVPRPPRAKARAAGCCPCRPGAGSLGASLGPPDQSHEKAPSRGAACRPGLGSLGWVGVWGWPC